MIYTQMTQTSNLMTSFKHNFNPTILREYDIRGRVGIDLFTQDAYGLGLAFGTMIARDASSKAGGHVCVGYDGRTTSPEMVESLIKGLTETGMRVTNVGLGPTPMLSFAVKHLKSDGGIMITGSHNPSDYNGFKISLQNAPVFGERIQKLGQIAADGDFVYGSGTTETVDIQDIYVERLLKDLTNTEAMTIAWDSGNGAAGEILRRLTAKLPGKHILLFDEIDGAFPNHHPDPTVDANLVDLQAAVKANNCDLGIAFDGDGDRIGVVDENGTVLRCDILMTIYAREVLESHPGASIIGDVKCSQVMFDDIARLGGNPVMWKTGHSLIKSKMAELKAPLAGELSGHIFFADKYYGFDDALYCSVRLMNAMEGQSSGLSSLTSHLPVLCSTPELRIEVDESEKFDLVPRIFESMAPQLEGRDDITIDDTDGIRISNAHGWWLLRASNTQNVLVARAEADSQDALHELISMAQAEVEKLGYSLKV